MERSAESPVKPKATSNPTLSITCSNVPESLFDTNNVKQHFSKFGRVTKITLKPKRSTCVIEYDTQAAVQRALLNAGAYDGFMFDVTRTKNKIQRRIKKEDDPEWLPDSDLEDELSVMSSQPVYRLSRQKPMEIEKQATLPVKRNVKPITKKEVSTERRTAISKPTSGIESPVLMIPTATTISTAEAATELHQLRSRVSLTVEEQWRTLEARDKILRQWGGTGSRDKVGGATIGTCRDMCPEKERLHRQVKNQVMFLETNGRNDSQLEAWRAVKQYSRSSADQELPLCYELRPPSVLRMTCNYLLHEIVNSLQVSQADWFHFLWDRFRGIRKDITQQALCCADSIAMLEMCARFHAHCAARLADLDHSQFDQKLNTDNLTKCLQTLKHMYADVTRDKKPNEAEFRAYIALLNLGDSNFLWEIKQLPVDIQKSNDIIFAINIFNALDNNNYIRFFRLIQEKATYLQACILLRYINDVRARGLARIVKAYAPRGGARYPAHELISTLAFEDVESMKIFINHYGLRIGKVDDGELTVILDRNQFVDDSDPLPLSRAVNLIESKRLCTVGEVINRGPLPAKNYLKHTLYSSFHTNGTLTSEALLSEDQGYNTLNDTNKNIRSLKTELLRMQTGKSYDSGRHIASTKSEPHIEITSTQKSLPVHSSSEQKTREKSFLFQSPIHVACIDNLKDSLGFVDYSKRSHAFAKPINIHICDNKSYNIISKIQNDDNVTGNIFVKTEIVNKKFEPTEKSSTNLFASATNKYGLTDAKTSPKSLFASKLNTEYEKTTNIFTKTASNIAQSNNTENNFEATNIFSNIKSNDTAIKPSNIFAKKMSENGPSDVTPSNLFKSAITSQDSKGYSIFKSKNNFVPTVDTLGSNESVYDSFEDDALKKMDDERQIEEKKREEQKQYEIKKQELQQQQQELQRLEEERRAEEARKKAELKIQEERRLQELKKQEESKKKREQEAKEAELKLKAEQEKLFREKVEKESIELLEALTNEVNIEIVTDLIKEESEIFRQLLVYAASLQEEVISEVCNDICQLEMLAERHLTLRLMRKWYNLWRKNFIRNVRRRKLLDNTPVWIPEYGVDQEAINLRKQVEPVALNTLVQFNRGHRFTGEIDPQPIPKPYKITDIIRSRFLKRMKEIHYPYDKCLFWKLTLISPGSMKWLNRKIDIEPWLLNAFSDNKVHESSSSLIYVNKYSWNSMIDFAISISLSNDENRTNWPELIEGSNALLFFTTDDDDNLNGRIDDVLCQRYPYQILPLVVIAHSSVDKSQIEHKLQSLAFKQIISSYNIFIVDKTNPLESLYKVTKKALKWLASKYPPCPPIEIDSLKSLCQRYLGNELWYKLKLKRNTNMYPILKNINHLVQIYNKTVDKLSCILTSEDSCNYPSFPLEFKCYLDETSPYPKPYEFIPVNVKNTENCSAIKDILSRLKLPNATFNMPPLSIDNVQQQIRSYCNQIGWFENPEEVVCRVVATLPHEFSETEIDSDTFSDQFNNYDLIDLLNVVVYEKINRLKHFDNRFAIYDKSLMKTFSSNDWWYDCGIVKNLKHKFLEGKDDIDLQIETKRRKILDESMEILEITDNDELLVRRNITQIDENIKKINDCTDAVQQLSDKIEEQKQKSLVFEMLLKAALADT